MGDEGVAGLGVGRGNNTFEKRTPKHLPHMCVPSVPCSGIMQVVSATAVVPFCWTAFVAFTLCARELSKEQLLFLFYHYGRREINIFHFVTCENELLKTGIVETC